MALASYNQRYSTADNQTAGTFAFDTVSSYDYAISKLAYGALGSVTHVDASNPLPVTGVITGTALTRLTDIKTNTDSGAVIGNGVAATAQRVTLASDSTGVIAATQSGTWTVTGAGGTFPVTDSGGTLTVDAPVGTPVFVRLSDGSAAITTLAVSLASVPSHAVTNAGVFAVQVDGALLTSSQLLDDVIVVLGTDTYTEATSKGTVIGAVRRDADTTLVNTTNEYGPLQMDANGRLKVEVFSGETLPVSLTSTTITGTVAVTQSGTWDEVGINDSGNSITVDAPVGTPVFVRLSDGSAAISTLPVSFTGSTDVATQTTLASLLTSSQLIDDAIVADDAAFTPATTKVMMAGFEFDDTTPDSVNEGDAGAARMSANRCIYVNVRDNAGNERGLNIDASGQLAVTIASGQTLSTVTTVSTVTTCSTVTSVTGITGGNTAHDAAGAAISPLPVGLYASAAAPSDVSADNDIVRAWALRNGALAVQPTFAGILAVAGNGVAGTGVQRVTIASDSTGILAAVGTVTTVSTLVGGGIAHDSADSGAPHKVGARCALTLSDDTMVANADRTDNVSDGDGALITRPQFPLADLISERVSDTAGTSAAFANFGATASTRNVITAIVAWNSSATAGYIDFRDGTAGAILYTVPIPATGGVVLPAGATPYFKTTANTALAYDVSGALTTVYISVSGYKSKVV